MTIWWAERMTGMKKVAGTSITFVCMEVSGRSLLRILSRRWKMMVNASLWDFNLLGRLSLDLLNYYQTSTGYISSIHMMKLVTGSQESWLLILGWYCKNSVWIIMQGHIKLMQIYSGTK